MWKNYLKTTIRNTIKQKWYTLGNVVCLSIGLTCCMLIMIWIRGELGYERFHENADRLFVVEAIDPGEEAGSSSFVTSEPLGPALVENVPEVESTTRFLPGGQRLIRFDDQRFEDDVVAVADPSFLQLFSLPLVLGDPLTALDAPMSVILTESVAQKYFGDINPLARTLRIELRDFTVTGVMQDIPTKSHMQFDCLVPFESRSEYLKQITDGNWQVAAYNTYVLLSEGTSAKSAGIKVNEVQAAHKGHVSSDLHLRPITELHLHSPDATAEGRLGGITVIYLFSAIAVLILMIACINYANLATARAGKRAREIGMRKVVGARRVEIAGQFLCESLFMTVMAVLLALALVELALPSFTAWAGSGTTLELTIDGVTLTGFIVVILVTSLLAGGYPAAILSAFRPARVLKGVSDSHRSTSRLRRILVVMQFAASAVLMISAGVIYKQLDYMTSGDLGFDKEHILNVWMRADFHDSYPELRDELLSMPGVVEVAAGTPPSTLSWASDDIKWEGKGTDDRVVAGKYNVDYDYFQVFGMKMVEGRPFSRDMRTDISEGYILNETAVKSMQLDNPLGSRFSFEGRPGTVVGVVRDFHFGSLRDEIPPLVLQMNPEDLDALSVKIAPGHTEEVLSLLESRWQELAGDYVFEYEFLDEAIDSFYHSERHIALVLSWSTALAVVIACLGLLGLAAFSAERRTKEIGIRKVLGSSVSGIVRIVTREFLILVTVANVIAWPVAWYLMSRWLESFAYRIDIGWEIFALSGGIVLALALVTINFVTIKAARANPVEALRCE